jgi:DNA polymerase-3 subunit gamma/tau
MEVNLDSIIDRIKLLEEKLAKGVVVEARESVSHTVDSDKEQAVKKQPVVLPEALPEDLKQIANNWKNIIGQIGRKSPALGTVLQSATPSIDNNRGLQIVVTENIDKDMIEREAHLQVINDTIAQMVQKQVQISVRYLDKSKERIDDVVDLSKLVRMPIQYE